MIASVWPTILITVGVFGLAIGGMALGVILRGRRLAGSCGGMANLRDEHGRPMCEGCSNPSPDCQKDQERREETAASEATSSA